MKKKSIKYLLFFSVFLPVVAPAKAGIQPVGSIASESLPQPIVIPLKGPQVAFQEAGIQQLGSLASKPSPQPIKLFERKNFFLKNPFSDLPLVDNSWVQQWIKAFQTTHADRFRKWLERSYRYIPIMRRIFQDENIPVDLVYIAMIESGYVSGAVSSAQAVGYWQFIDSTARRFGLKKTNWLDERRDFEHSTYAASRYLKILYKQFQDWYLAAAAYNMGEKRLSGFIKKYQTKNFWRLAQKHDFPSETANYIPQLIAAITIAKAPSLYGFNYLKPKSPPHYEIFYLPGGTNLRSLSYYIKEPYRKIKILNPGFLSDRVPEDMENWRFRIPRGSSTKVSRFIEHYLM